VVALLLVHAVHLGGHKGWGGRKGGTGGGGGGSNLGVGGGRIQGAHG
jgi:hypothetical protein